tara:strand:+ start:1411 stop:2367 length:957 start_codon:yes stop_codon:yes gene_type:complete
METIFVLYHYALFSITILLAIFSIMKILIGISSKKYSEPTLDVGMRIASILNSSTTILDVGEKINEFSYKDVSIANELMESWDLDRPGVDVLEWAYNYLQKENYIAKSSNETGFSKNLLVDKGSGRFEVFLKGSAVKNLSLILRNGDIIEELRDEVQSYNYDLTIIGGSGKRSMAHDLVQYVDSSIFVVNNFNQKQKYKILLAVDESRGNKKAVKFAVRVAQAFNIEVDIVSISNEVKISEKLRLASLRAEKMMRRTGVKSKISFIEGNLVNTLVDAAGDNHIIIMGTSSQSPISKFFLGSKPLAVMESCNCPVVIAK